jgi:hypothetical protein
MSIGCVFICGLYRYIPAGEEKKYRDIPLPCEAATPRGQKVEIVRLYLSLVLSKQSRHR